MNDAPNGNDGPHDVPAALDTSTVYEPPVIARTETGWLLTVRAPCLGPPRYYFATSPTVTEALIHMLALPSAPGFMTPDGYMGHDIVRHIICTVIRASSEGRYA